jgi:hypothetical protein
MRKNSAITAATLVMTLRHLFLITLVSLAGLNSQAQDQTLPIARVSVHDPVIIRQNGAGNRRVVIQRQGHAAVET